MSTDSYKARVIQSLRFPNKGDLARDQEAEGYDSLAEIPAEHLQEYILENQIPVTCTDDADAKTLLDYILEYENSPEMSQEEAKALVEKHEKKIVDNAERMGSFPYYPAGKIMGAEAAEKGKTN